MSRVPFWELTVQAVCVAAVVAAGWRAWRQATSRSPDKGQVSVGRDLAVWLAGLDVLERMHRVRAARIERRHSADLAALHEDLARLPSPVEALPWLWQVKHSAAAGGSVRAARRRAPGGGHPGSLLTQLEPLVGRNALGWVAESPRETLMLVDQVAEQLEQRKAGWRKHHGDQRPLVLLIDEFAESLLLLPPGDRERLLDRIQVLGYSGRKYDVACVLLAQSWLTGAINSSQVRNPLRAAVVHAMRADEGRALTGLRAEAWPSDPVDLSPGEAYVLGVGSSGLIRVRVPLLESPPRAPARASAPNSNLASEWLPTGFRPGFQPELVEANGKPDGSLVEANVEPTDEVDPTAEDWRIAELFDQGLDIAEIARQMFNVTSANGRRYQQKSRDVQAALRRVRQATQ